jgi:formate dehydrogenase subunit gamma
VRLVRFDAVERVVHWSTALLMIELILTGAALYIPDISLQIGHRSLVEEIHIYSGIALLAPLAAGMLGPWRGALLEDLRRLDRWTKADWAWFHRGRQDTPRELPGKFNGGQKAEAALLGSGMVVMLATGLVMRYAPSSWITWQRGATLVHDVGFIAIGLAVIGHLSYGFSRSEQLRSMVTGDIELSWAKRHAPAWLQELGVQPLTDRAPLPLDPSALRNEVAEGGRSPASCSNASGSLPEPPGR